MQTNTPEIVRFPFSDRGLATIFLPRELLLYTPSIVLILVYEKLGIFIKQWVRMRRRNYIIIRIVYVTFVYESASNDSTEQGNNDITRHGTT